MAETGTPEGHHTPNPTSPTNLANPTSGRRALIVGGGTGLGLAGSLALAARGWRVFLTGRRADRLEQAQALHPAGQCHWSAGDATSPDDVQRVVRECVAALGGLDALVISAGQGGVGSVLQADLADFERVMRASVWPVFLYSQAAVPHFGPQGGAICAIASVTASVPQLERVAYCSAKAAVVGMVRQIALDLAPRRIRVNAISPSLVPTELSMGAIAKAPDPQALLASRIRSHPIGRIGTAQEIGQAVAWLCSDDAGWITGQDLVMDGGLSLTAGVPR
jgi:meso-butanediol dehydrogenase/(S,S)-butanediol dehydrogenase/diacetyl reductase